MLINTWSSVFYLKIIMDFLIADEYLQAIVFSATFPPIIFVFQTLFDLVQYYKAVCEKIINIRMNADLAEKQFKTPFYEFDTYKTKIEYDFAKKAINFTGVNQALEQFGVIISNIVSFVGVIFVFSRLSLWLILILIVIICVNSICSVKKMQYKYNQTEEETADERGLYYARDYLTGPVFAKEARSFGLNNYIISKIKLYIQRLFLRDMKTQKKYYKMFGSSYLLYGIQFAVVYAYIGYLLYLNAITVSEFTAYTAAVFVFSSAVTANITAASGIIQNSKYISCLRKVLRYAQLNKTDNKSIECGLTLPLTLTFENVSFRYDDSLPYVIENLSFEIHGNEKICFVGENGAGKTTLVKLLMGMYLPTSGCIKINGTDITQFDPREYTNLFSTVFQDFNIFAFSVAENITMGQSYNENKLNAVIEEVGLREKIASFNKGAEVFITDRMVDDGIYLSGGEEQLLALARALYKNAPILILDEPTSALSPQNEFLFYQKFHRISKDKTVIYISHRMASCRFADKIFVLDNGHLAECGTHEHLMQLKGKYYQLFILQASRYHNDRENSYE